MSDNEKRPLTFRQWIQEKAPDFIFDDASTEIVKKLGMWAFRDPRFNQPSVLHHLDKSICLIGKVGTGKTNIMRLLQKYLIYLGSAYRYRSFSVPDFCDRYRDDPGVMRIICDPDTPHNLFVDELGLLDDNNVPYKEIVNDFGNKNYIGRDIILKRYPLFKARGLMLHITSNLVFDPKHPQSFKSVYGERCFSRMCEMVNFIQYKGTDRRQMITAPTFYINENNYQPAVIKVSNEDFSKTTMAELNMMYHGFIANGSTAMFRGFEFELLKMCGVTCATDDELNKIRLDMEIIRIEQINKPAISVPESKRFKILKKQYADHALDAEEKTHLWMMVKNQAVKNYFTKLAEQGQQNIFDI